MLLTGEDTRVFQLHLTSRCNLRCTHCYSSSSPEAREEVPHRLALQAVSEAAELGYNTISFSGGEPLLIKGLAEIANEAKSLGMHVNLVTNGMLLNAKRMEELAGLLAGMAISLDGAPERHNRMRGAANAFEKMESNLELLRSSGLPFGFVFTLSTENLGELEWAAEFACDQGARLLQIHPLETAGRARLLHAGEDPQDDVAARGWLLALRLKQIYQGRMSVEVDLANVQTPPLASEEALRRAHECAAGTRPLGRFLSPLVLEVDGRVVPLQYGFTREYALGLLQRESLPAMARRWTATKAVALAHDYGRALRQEGWPLVNLYQRLNSVAAKELTQLLPA